MTYYDLYATKNVRWTIGVFLTGLGSSNFLLFIMFNQFCYRTGLSAPDPLNGIIYPFTEKARTLFVSLFDHSAILLLKDFSLPLLFLASVIVPHELVLLPNSKYQWFHSKQVIPPENQPDFSPVVRRTIGLSGFIASPTIAWFFGNDIIDIFNHLCQRQ